MSENNSTIAPEDSILNTTKAQMSIQDSYEHFDKELIIFINSVFSILTQLGIGPSEGYSIKDQNDSWSDFLSDTPKLNMVKTYMYMKTRLMFDPPSSSIVSEAIKEQIKELEFRMNVQEDRGENYAWRD